MVKNYYRLYMLFLLVSFTYSLEAQRLNHIKYKANHLYEVRENGKKLRYLVGSVVFKQVTATMYCDSSIFYAKENIMEAYGHIKIIDKSVTITADRLIYNGTDRTAKLRGNVVYIQGEQRLTTNFLDYNLQTEVGKYYNNGKLQDSVNVLTSKSGYFYGKDHYSNFQGDVVLKAPEYVLETNDLLYQSIPKVAITKGFTKIITEGDVILHANGGNFKTQLYQSEFIEGNIETEDYYLKADQLFFDDIKKYYDATGNVTLTAKNKDIIIIGEEGYTDKKTGISKIYGHAIMKRILETDTLYLSADTLISIESEKEEDKRILAFQNVKIWRYNLQGLADSVAYFLADSMVYFYRDPIFWNEKRQIEGDTVILEITQNQIKQLMMRRNAFMIYEDTLQNHNQVKGRNMFAHFIDNDISRIDVKGNGQGIYFILDDSDSSHIFTMGLNYIICSNMAIRFQDRQLDNISFYIKPEAKFIPPHEFTPEIKFLPGFEWRYEEKPTLSDIYYEYSTFYSEDKIKNTEETKPIEKKKNIILREDKTKN